jgi:hypothetical protein
MHKSGKNCDHNFLPYGMETGEILGKFVDIAV